MLRFASDYLSPALSLAFVFFASIGYFCSLIFPTTILFWDSLLILSVLAALILVIYFKPFAEERKNQKSYSSLENLLGLLPYLIFLPLLIGALQSIGRQTIGHAEFHGTYVMQLLNGIGQPYHAYVFGEAPNYYWLYHALIAALTHLSGLPHPLVRVYLSLILFLLTVAWGHRILPLIVKRQYSPFASSLIVIFCLFSLNLFGFIHSMLDIRDNFNIWNFFALIAPEAIGDFRLTSIMRKFTGYTSFPFALLYAWVNIYVMLKILQARAKAWDIFWFIIAIAGAAAYTLLGGVYVALALIGAGLLCFFINLLLKRQSLSQLWSFKISKEYWLIAFGLLILFPIMLYLGATRDSSEAKAGVYFTLVNMAGLSNVFGGLYPFFPFLLAAIYIAWLKKENILILLLICALTTMLIGAFITITGSNAGNEYKFVIYAALFIGPLAVHVIEHFSLDISLNDKESKAIALTVPMMLILYFCIAMNNFGLAAYSNPSVERISFTYDGQLVNDPLSAYNDVYLWLRDNSSTDTVVVMPIVEARFLALLSERIPYVAETHFDQADFLPSYQERLIILDTLWTDSPDSQDWQNALQYVVETSLNRPLVFVFPEGSPAQANDLSAFGLSKVFEGEAASIYLLERSVESN